jgi:hypothetical protein
MLAHARAPAIRAGASLVVVLALTQLPRSARPLPLPPPLLVLWCFPLFQVPGGPPPGTLPTRGHVAALAT